MNILAGGNSNAEHIHNSDLYPMTCVSVERKNPRKRDQALNDSTGGKLGEEPKPEPYPEKDPRRKVIHRKSKQV